MGEIKFLIVNLFRKTETLSVLKRLKRLSI